MSDEKYFYYGVNKYKQTKESETEVWGALVLESGKCRKGRPSRFLKTEIATDGPVETVVTGYPEDEQPELPLADEVKPAAEVENTAE